MIAGTMFGIWLGQLISEYGIPNQGLSLIIFAGIISRIPTNLRYLCWLIRRMAGGCCSLILVILALTIFAIVYVQQGRRNVPVLFPGRRVGNRMSMPVQSNLPLMVNMAGMIPLIFAQSILTFPAIIASYFMNSETDLGGKLCHWRLFNLQWSELCVFDPVLPDGGGFHLLLHGCALHTAELW